MSNLRLAFLTVCILAAAILPSEAVWAKPSAQTPACAEDYTIQAGDWLSTIAEKFYGDPLIYTALVEATNRAARTDTKYTAITNPANVEVGQILCIPDATEAVALAEERAAMLAGTVVEPHRMLVIVGNRSLDGLATEFTLSGGNFGEGETFPIAAGHEISLQVDPGFYQAQWTVPGGTLSRDFEAVADVVTLVYVVPEHNQVFAENQWAGGRAGSPRGETELGWPHLASVQTGETPYGLDTPGQALLMAGNVSREALYARLTLTRPSGEVLKAIINPGQETLLLIEPGVYQATWQTIDGVTDDPYNLSGQFTIEPDTVTALWVLPEARFGFVQSPGLAGQMLE